MTFLQDRHRIQLGTRAVFINGTLKILKSTTELCRLSYTFLPSFQRTLI